MSAHDISVSDASTKTQNFQLAYPQRNKAVSIPKSEIMELLNQPGCIGLRMYFSVSHPADPKEIGLVIVGVKDDGSGDFRLALDMVPDGGDPSFRLKDNCLPCPPQCSASF